MLEKALKDLVSLPPDRTITTNFGKRIRIKQLEEVRQFALAEKGKFKRARVAWMRLLSWEAEEVERYRKRAEAAWAKRSTNGNGCQESSIDNVGEVK